MAGYGFFEPKSSANVCLQSPLLRDFSNTITNSLKAFVRPDTNHGLIAPISNINSALGCLLDQSQLLQARFHVWHIYTSVISANVALSDVLCDVRLV